MLNFLIQTIDGRVRHDFAFHLLEAEAFVHWTGREMRTAKTSLETLRRTVEEGHPDVFRGFVPVGSVEFVSDYLRANFPLAEAALRPLNVPVCLFPFAGRKIVNVETTSDLDLFSGSGRLWKKSNSLIKDPSNGLLEYRTDSPENFLGCQVSEEIDILSEWRVIVFHDEILYLAPYSGDCMVFPSAEAVRRMVGCYKGGSPAAYTLDVAVTATGTTVVMECHRFFSCGLYGFADYGKLPYMFSQTWYEMINTK